MIRYLLIALFSASFFASSAATTDFKGAGGKLDTFAKGAWFPIHVTGVPGKTSDSFGFEYVNVKINCQYSGYITMYLYTPSGGYYPLVSYTGSTTGKNYDSTYFTDTATNPIHFGKAPFRNTYISESYLRDINLGQMDTGMWYLVVFDGNHGKDALVYWHLGLGTNPNRDARIDSSNIPIVVLNTMGQSVPAWDPAANTKMYIIDNPGGKMNYLKDSSKFSTYCGIKQHGNWSRSFPKQSYSIEMRDSDWNVHDTAILGMPKEHDWALLANYLDRSLMRNALAQHLFSAMGNYSPRARHVEVVMNGKYQGVYTFIEKIKQGKKRVNIAKMDTFNYNSGDSLTGGYIIKQDWKGSWGWNSKYGKPDDTAWHAYFRYDNPSLPSWQQAAYIHSFYDSFENELYGKSIKSYPGANWRNYMDEASMMDYYFTNEIAANVDGFRASFYMWKDRNSKDRHIHLGPVWDFDITMGDWWGPWNAWYFNNGGSNGDFWWFKLLGNKYPEIPKGGTAWYNYGPGDSLFKNELKCRWTLHRRGGLSQVNLDHWIDSNATVLKDAQARNFKEWMEWGWGIYLSEPANPKNYTGEIDSLKGWMHRRMKWMDKYMPGTCRRDLNPPTVTLLGFDTVYLEVNTRYRDSGIVYHDNFGDTNVTVIKGTNLDTSSLGTYLYQYFLSDKAGNKASVQRVIIVIDTIAPTIVFLGGDTVKTEVLEVYKDNDVVIADNYDVSPTIKKYGTFAFPANIPDTLGYFTIWYKAWDHSGNIDSALRVIHVVDSKAPVISMKGPDTVRVEVYNSYNDTDVSISDNYDKAPMLSHNGNLKNFKTDSLGYFTLWYKGLDHSGNKDSITRTIMVIDTIAPVITLKGKDSAFVFMDSTYSDLGYVVSDNYDKKPKVDTSGNYINTLAEGVFTLAYHAKDQSANGSISVNRIITVLKDTTSHDTTGSGINSALNANSNIRIFPNPGKGDFMINVKLAGNEKAWLYVYDVMGREMKEYTTQVYNGWNMKLDLGNQPSGVYALKLQTSGTSVIAKLILSK